MPNEGDVIRGRYKLLAHLGDGGTASVWKALDRTLEREVAIKFLYCADERRVDQLRKQFLREARIACAVKHRNVIQTMDFGQTDDGQAYMVMELLTGVELAQKIGAEPPMTIPEIVQTLSLTLRGLSAIHEAGIIHRDLKPENIYLEADTDGTFPKILDFGIAKSTDPRGSRRSVLTTKEGVVVGTPEYMSPEQARGRPDLDARSDIWSVGVVLFELLSGEQPFKHKYTGELIIQIATTDAPRVTDIDPDIPEPLAEVVAKALARDPDARYQTANEMLKALHAAAEELEHGAVPRPTAQVPVQVPGKRDARRLLWPLGGVVLAALALLTLRPCASAPEQAYGAAPAADSGALSAGAADAPPTTFKVQLQGVPADATVLVNGKPAAGTNIELADDGHSRLIEVHAPGRLPWRVMHPAGNSANYQVRMQEAKAFEPSQVPTAPTAPTSATAPAPASVPTPAKPAPAARQPVPRPSGGSAGTTRKATPDSTRKPARKKLWRDADF